ncbi:MAG: ABC transporter ATP-binding protein [Actinomycetota bacterium]
MIRLCMQGVAVDLAGCPIVSDVDLAVAEGELVGLIGPNGSGKSTLLRCIYRALRPSAGIISLDGDLLGELSARETARRVAVVSQEGPADFDFTVWEVVAMGRTPHKNPLDRDTAGDRRICFEALERVGLEDTHGRLFKTLSGGERQRVLIARALAQRCRLHLLDEPTSHLDVRYQVEILELVRGLGHATLAAIHDLNLASSYCDRVCVLVQGHLVADGHPDKILTPQLVGEVFGVRAHGLRHPVSGRTIFAFEKIASSRPPAALPEQEPVLG